MESLQMWGGLIFGFSWLVFIHELGHFLLAKWNGVRVHVFSIGMGPYLCSFTIGETVYVLSLIPIGGYVKMAGQDDMRPDLAESRDPRDYRNKRPGQRAAILAAGAAFNLIFAFLAFSWCYYVGVPMEPARVGSLEPESPLKSARKITAQGEVDFPLQYGDRILTVHGEPVKSILDASMVIANLGGGKEVDLTIERNGVPVLEPITISTRHDFKLGAATLGISTPYMAEETFRIGVEAAQKLIVDGVNKNSSAEEAGLKTGDKIESIDGFTVKSSGAFIDAVRSSEGRPMELTIWRGEERITQVIQARYDDEAKTYLLGIQLGQFHIVEAVDPTSPAYEKGLREGHIIVGVDQRVSSNTLKLWYAQETGNESSIRTMVLPDRLESSPYMLRISQIEWETIQCANLLDAVALAWNDTVRYSMTVFAVVGGLITGKVSVKALNGPVGIATIITRVSKSRPLVYYFWFLALLSINLGMLQFIPIPLLDGWHLLMVLIEKLKGSPVRPKIQEAFQYVGLFLILALMLMATKNDITRFFF